MATPATGARTHGSVVLRGPWAAAWLILLPLALWVAVGKTVLLMNSMFQAPQEGFGPVALFMWLWWFKLVRFLLALAAGYAIQRLFFPRHRLMILPIAAVIIVALAGLRGFLRGEGTLGAVLHEWVYYAFELITGLAICLVRDVASIALLALGFGLVLWLAPRRTRRCVVRLLQGVVIALCALTGIAVAYEFGTGQPASLTVLLFTAQNLKGLVPLIASETTAFRALSVFGGVLAAAVWTWRQSRRAATLAQARPQHPDPAALVALGLSLALLLSTPSVQTLAMVRHTEGVLVALARTTRPTLAAEVRAKVVREFETTGRPRAYSAGMKLQQTGATKRRNVVIVLLESARAESTTPHTPRLATTPFLKQLADQGLWVEDMSAVVPRTAAAWIAVLAGQYPLANEVIARWAHQNKKHRRLRALPSVLGDVGYATAFFTPTDLNFQSDNQVVDALGFQLVRSEKDFTYPGAERVTYFGVADELMVEPILAWSAAQASAGRPFLATVMTNVGHHDFRTPASWKKLQFEGVTDPALNAYYNCLRYVDTVVESLVDGYRRLGLLEDTIFVFVGDHGQMFSEHATKQSFNAVYEEGLHVPAVIYAPGMGLQPRRIRGPRQQVDIVPTLVELLGYSIEGAVLPGSSLLQPVDPNRKLFYTSSIDWSFLAARHGPRKYIYSFGRRPMEVFDLASDPGELRPLPDVSPAELAGIQQDMLEWRLHAELSMLARPVDPADPTGPWRKK